MVRALVVFATTEGYTRKIAERVAGMIRQRGHEATAIDAASATDLADAHDAIVVCASVHQGRHQSAIIHFVKHNLADLDALPSAFFSVSLTAALPDDEHEAEARGYIDAFIADTGWRPDFAHPVAGALRYTEYDYVKRLLARLIAKRLGGDADPSRDYEYTDWNRLEQQVAEFLNVAETRCEARARTARLVGD